MGCHVPGAPGALQHGRRAQKPRPRFFSVRVLLGRDTMRLVQAARREDATPEAKTVVPIGAEHYRYASDTDHAAIRTRQELRL